MHSSETEDLLTQLIRIPSVNPHVNDEGLSENRITDFLSEKLEEWGFDVKLQNVSSSGNIYKFLPEKPEAKRMNVIARFGTSSKRKLVLNGHVDTVSGINMKDPFNPVIQDGFLRGRGASDMKGGAAAMIIGARAVMECDAEIDGTVILTLVVDEEVWGAGTSTFVNSEKVDYAVVCEPSELKICTSQAGYIDLNIMSRGESRHGSTIAVGQPTSAVLNAICICSSIARLQSLKEVVTYDGVDMPNTMNLAPIPTTILPSYAWMSYEQYGMNILLGIAPRKNRNDSERLLDSILAEIVKLVDESNLKGEHNRVEVNAKYHGFIQEKDEFVQEVEAAVRGIQGTSEYAHQLSFCDGTFFRDAGVPTLLLGPGKMDMGHSSYEQVDVAQLRRAAAIYADVMEKVLS